MDKILKKVRHLLFLHRDKNLNKKLFFELSGGEGTDWKDMAVTEVSFNGKNRSHYFGGKKVGTIRFYVKVVGFRDVLAPQRNWGRSFREDEIMTPISLKKFANRILVKGGD